MAAATARTSLHPRGRRSLGNEPAKGGDTHDAPAKLEIELKAARAAAPVTAS
jgi:hypothetical protein